MEVQRSRDLRASSLESHRMFTGELVKTHKITIGGNKAARNAFMNNAPVDNFGTKEYYGCIFGDVTINADCSAILKGFARCDSPRFLFSTNTSAANTIDKAVRRCIIRRSIQPEAFDDNQIRSYPKLSWTANEVSVSMFSIGGRKSGEALMKICPGLASNWICEDTVRRCKLDSKRRATVKNEKYERVILTSTGNLVELICPGKSCRHRFHIIENPPFQFDVLYGVNDHEQIEEK